MIRKRKLREEYALLWLGSSLAIFLLSVFGGLVNLLADFFNVSYAPTLILVAGLLFALTILLSHSVALSTQADRTRDLAQTIALLEWRLNELEAERRSAASSLPPENGDGPDPERLDPDRAVQAPAIPAAANGKSRAGKVLVVGLDGATFDLIKPWALEGYLPTLSRLMREGAHGLLGSTVPPMTAPAWTSFATGTNPGKHGLYDWIAREPRSYRFSPVTARDCRAPSLYTLLSQAGRRVCSLNVPMTYPAMPVNGVMVAGLPAPGPGQGLTYPAELYDEIVDAVGDYIVYPDPGQAYSDSGVAAFLERLYRCTELRIRTFDYLREREAWDFAMVVFNGTDTICHALWKYMDQDHPLYNARHAARYGNAIRDYYRALDDYLAKIVERLDDDTTLIVMSDHGFGPFHKFIHVNNWLMREGFMHLQSRPRTRLKGTLFRLGMAPMNAYNLLMRFGLGALKREVVRGQGQGLLKTLFLSFEDVDWSRTVAYSLGNVGQIHLNVVGREPLGCVPPGEAYERARDEIIARLWELRDPETGEQVVETVYRREEIYHGDELERAPDIVFIPRRLEYFGFGEYEFGSHKIIEAMERGISGTHRMNGIFLAYGAGIRPGVVVDGANLVDLAPTILYLMGEPIPEHVDGRILTEILRGDVVVTPRKERPDQWQRPPDEPAPTLSQEDEALLRERLRSLGYVG